MAANPTGGWQPDWGVAPGEILQEALDERGMSQSELARRMDRPIKTINEIVKGKSAITPETAIQLERALGISANLWMGLESNFRQYLARESASAELETQIGWLDRFPVRDMVREGLLPRGLPKAELVEAVLRFFGVSSPSAWERQFGAPSAAFRASPSFESRREAVASWLRWGELEASRIECPPFNAEHFKSLLGDLRGLSRHVPVMAAIDELKELCLSAGVIVLTIPELTGTRLSGAARWLSTGEGLIQLSLRHKSDDHLWFTFFHEAAHLLRASRGNPAVVDEWGEGVVPDDEEERAADEFARNHLIPSMQWDAFVATNEVTRTSVRAFAKSVGVSPGIVVGRLQRDRLIARSALNDLKKPVGWTES